jgi:hypothetical protein
MTYFVPVAILALAYIIGGNGWIASCWDSFKRFWGIQKNT